MAMTDEAKLLYPKLFEVADKVCTTQHSIVDPPPSLPLNKAPREGRIPC